MPLMHEFSQIFFKLFEEFCYLNAGVDSGGCVSLDMHIMNPLMTLTVATLLRHQGTRFSNISMKIHKFSFKENTFENVKWQPFWGASVCPGDCFKNPYELLNLRALKCSPLWIKYTSFTIWVRYFVCNFKGCLWNSTQNIFPIHWKMWF